MRTKAFVFFSFLLVLPLHAHALSLRGGEEVRITEAVEGDLYAGGGRVEVSNVVSGDAIIAAGEISVKAPVEEDLTVMGGRIWITAPVGDDVRVAGGEVVIEGDVKGDLIIAAGRLIVSEDVTVYGDVFMNGGEMDMRGDVRGSLEANGGTLQLSGTVEGNMKTHVEELKMTGKVQSDAHIIASKLVLSEGALFQNNLEYWTASGEMDLSIFVGGDANYNSLLAPDSLEGAEKADRNVAGVLAVFVSFFFAYSILSSGLVILILTLLTKDFFKRSATFLKVSPGSSFLWGLLFFVGSPVIILAFMFTVIGIPIGLFLLFVYIFTILFSKVLAAMVFAQLLLTQYKPEWKTVPYFFLSLLIFLCLKLLMFIPIVGWIIRIIIVYFAIGAVLRTKYQLLKRMR